MTTTTNAKPTNADQNTDTPSKPKSNLRGLLDDAKAAVLAAAEDLADAPARNRAEQVHAVVAAVGQMRKAELQALRAGQQP